MRNDSRAPLYKTQYGEAYISEVGLTKSHNANRGQVCEMWNKYNTAIADYCVMILSMTQNLGAGL